MNDNPITFEQNLAINDIIKRDIQYLEGNIRQVLPPHCTLEPVVDRDPLTIRAYYYIKKDKEVQFVSLHTLHIDPDYRKASEILQERFRLQNSRSSLLCLTHALIKRGIQCIILDNENKPEPFTGLPDTSR